MAEFQTACATEHDIQNPKVTDDSQCPLTEAVERAKARDKHTRPENHFTQIVGTADKAIQAGTDKTMGVNRFSDFLLLVSNGFHEKTKKHEHDANICKYIASTAIIQTVEYRTDHRDIEYRTENPNGYLCNHGNCFVVLDVISHVLIIASEFHLTVSQITTQPQTIDDKEQTTECSTQTQGLTIQQKQEQSLAGDGKTIANREEPDVIFKTNGTDGKGYRNH